MRMGLNQAVAFIDSSEGSLLEKKPILMMLSRTPPTSYPLQNPVIRIPPVLYRHGCLPTWGPQGARRKTGNFYIRSQRFHGWRYIPTSFRHTLCSQPVGRKAFFGALIIANPEICKSLHSSVHLDPSKSFNSWRDQQVLPKHDAVDIVSCPSERFCSSIN